MEDKRKKAELLRGSVKSARKRVETRTAVRRRFAAMLALLMTAMIALGSCGIELSSNAANERPAPS